MSASEDFERAVRFSLNDLYGAQQMRSEAVEAAEGGVNALGLEPVLQAYLSTTFGAKSLADLSDAQLRRALLFIAQLERQAGPAAPRLPWLNGSFEGEVLWVRGKVAAAGG